MVPDRYLDTTPMALHLLASVMSFGIGVARLNFLAGLHALSWCLTCETVVTLATSVRQAAQVAGPYHL